jgi:hypothetical protein
MLLYARSEPLHGSKSFNMATFLKVSSQHISNLANYHPSFLPMQKIVPSNESLSRALPFSDFIVAEPSNRIRFVAL